MSEAAFDLVITGGTVVTEAGEFLADVGIRGEEIAAIGPDLAGREVIDATGHFLLPGGVDPHVHFSAYDAPPEPAWVDDFASGSRAAAAGGVTTVGHMSYPWYEQTLGETIARDRALAERDGIIDFAFHPVLTNPATQPISEIPELAEQGHTTLKYFMSLGEYLRDPAPYAHAMRLARAADVPVLIHCEDAALLQDAMAALVEQGKTAPEFYPLSRPQTVEAAATARAVAFAEQTGASTYVVHLSCIPALEEVRRGRERGLDLWIETRPIYLFLTEERFAEPDGGKYFGQPPLRTQADQDALWEALASGEINTVATDHAPWMYADKVGEHLDIRTIPPGVADLDVMLPMLWSHGVNSGRITRQRFVQVTSSNAARLLGLYPRKGVIAVGSDADIVIWDPDLSKVIHAADFQSKSDYTPYEGWNNTGWPVMTISRGEVIVKNSEILAKPGRATVPRRNRVPSLREA
ncbi:MAG: dihydropyrimidinase [Thermomicrobiales bacterium]|nr:dihydropyrimidinase [Thermomicrobiales bacterium]